MQSSSLLTPVLALEKGRGNESVPLRKSHVKWWHKNGRRFSLSLSQSERTRRRVYSAAHEKTFLVNI
jgi:hypothetical protein